MAFFLNISPGFVDAMKIPIMDGRDFRTGDTYPGAAIVSETFAKRFFKGANPVGRWFERATDEGPRLRMQVVGLVRDARYLEMREIPLPVAYIPFRQVDAQGALQPVRRGTVMVRTAGANPRALARMLSREVAKARPEFRVGKVETQAEINQVFTVRERLLAVLGLFFAAIALLLSGGAKSASAWPSARKPARSRGWSPWRSSPWCWRARWRASRWAWHRYATSKRCSTR
jgi:hypothetical protein